MSSNMGLRRPTLVNVHTGQSHAAFFLGDISVDIDKMFGPMESAIDPLCHRQFVTSYLM